MIRFSLAQTSAVITNINQRIEKHGPEEKEVGFDIDIKAMYPVNQLNDLAIGCKIDYEKMFYDKDGVLNQSGITKLVFDRKYEEHRLRLALDTITEKFVIIPDVTIKKFSAVLDANKQVKLHFQVQCHANDEALLFLRQALIRDSIFVEIEEPPQQEMPLDDEKTA